MTLNATFVLEQTLGHVTHAQNLQSAAAHQRLIQPSWLPIEFSRDLPYRLLPRIGENWSIQASWKARRALTAELRKRSTDALFFHSQVTSLFSIDSMRRIPSIISLDATPINFDSVGHHYGHAASDGGLLDQVKYQLNRTAFQSAQALVCWSNWARQSLISDYAVPEDRVRVIAPGADARFFDIGRQRLARQRLTPLNAGGPLRILFVGSSFQRKGGPLLLECMRGSLGECCELHVVTSDPIASQGNVTVHNGINPNSLEMLALFEMADVFVLPSLADCLAVVLAEASAAGLPIITTNVGALHEAVEHSTSGFVIPPGDPAALSRAIADIHDNHQLRIQMSQRSHELAIRKFNA
ncbi:MAG: glycosyltransferase family 4 protein, partial [Chloroflexota bacterium]